MENIVSKPTSGVKKDIDPRNLTEGDLTFAKNVTYTDNGTDQYELSYEKSNILFSNTGGTYTVIGYAYRLKTDTIYLFQVNDEGYGRISYLPNKVYEDISYDLDGCEGIKEVDTTQAFGEIKTLIDDECKSDPKDGFNFHRDFPIKTPIIKEEKTGGILYFTNNRGAARKINLDKIEQYYQKEIPCEDPIEIDCPDFTKMSLRKSYKLPKIHVSNTVEGGTLKDGAYQFLIALSDANGEELSEYTSITQPTKIFSKTNSKGIEIMVSELDLEYTHYKLVSIFNDKTDNSETIVEVGTYPITQTTVFIPSLENKPRVSRYDLNYFTPNVVTSENLTEVSGSLVEYGLKFERELNLQPIANILGSFVKWQTHVTTEDYYKKGESQLGYNRNEVVPLGIRFLRYGGTTTANFPLVGREALPYDKEIIPPSNRDRKSFESNDSCVDNLRNERWQYYNTADIDPNGCGGEDTIVTIGEDIERSCTISGVAEIPEGVFEGKEIFDVIQYIEDNKNDPLSFEGTEIYEYLHQTYNQECFEGLFEDNCESPAKIGSNMFIESIEWQNIGSKPINDVTKYPDFENPYNGQNTQEDPEFEYKVWEQSQVPGTVVSYNPVTPIYRRVIPEGVESTFKQRQTPNTSIRGRFNLSNASSIPAYFYIDNMSVVGQSASSKREYMTFGREYKRTNQSGTEQVEDKGHFTYIKAQPTQNFPREWVGNAKMTFTIDKNTLEGVYIISQHSSGNGGSGEALTDKIRFTISNMIASGSGKESDEYELIISKETTQGQRHLISIEQHTEGSTVRFMGEEFQVGNNTLAVTLDTQELIVGEYELYNAVNGYTAHHHIIQNQPSKGIFQIVRTQTITEPYTAFGKIRLGLNNTYKTTCTYTETVPDVCSFSPNKTGRFAYWESLEQYPDNGELYDSSKLKIDYTQIPLQHQEDIKNIVGQGQTVKSSFDLRCKPIRHFKFPSNSVSPFMDNNPKSPFSSSYIYPLGVTINEEKINIFLDIALQNNLITREERDSIYGYEIMRGDLKSNRSVISSGLLYDFREYSEKGRTVSYPNYPYNSFSEDYLNPESHTSQDFGDRGYKFTYHSPETDFTGLVEGNEVNLEGYLFGKSTGHFDEVQKHPKWTILSSKAYRTASTLATMEVTTNSIITAGMAAVQIDSWFVVGMGGTGTNAVGTTIQSVASGLITAAVAFGNIVYEYARYKMEWQKIFRDLGQSNNYASYYFSEGDYNQFKNHFSEGDYIRRINTSKKLPSGRFYITDNVTREKEEINNLQREESTYITLGKDNYLNYESSYKNYDRESITYLGKEGLSETGRSTAILKNIASPYAQIVSYSPNQHGSISSINWLYTGYRGDLRAPRTDCLPIFGGDTYITRHTLKRKMPLFLTTSMGQADKTPFNYELYNNIGKKPLFYCNYETNSEFTNNGKTVPEIKSEFNFDNEATKGFYQIPPSKFYLYYYGIPSFLCETRINTNYRESGKDSWEQFYPEVGDIGEWTQESKVPITTPNFYKYSSVFSNQVNSHNTRTLIDTYKRENQDVLENSPNGAIISMADRDENSTKDPWTKFKPLDFFEFETKYGKLVELKGIENEAVIARFNDTTILYNKVDSTTDTGQSSTTRLGGKSIFSRRTASFVNADIGYGGSKQTKSLSCEYGHFSLDTDRGQILHLAPNGTNLVDISEKTLQGQPTFMKSWVKRHLPFKLKSSKMSGARDIPEDNNFNGIGTTLGFDSDNGRVVITKKDYVPLKECVKYSKEFGFYSEEAECGGGLEGVCPEGYTKNEENGMCEKEYTKVACKPGWELDEETGQCRRLKSDGVHIIYMRPEDTPMPYTKPLKEEFSRHFEYVYANATVKPTVSLMTYRNRWSLSQIYADTNDSQRYDNIHNKLSNEWSTGGWSGVDYSDTYSAMNAICMAEQLTTSYATSHPSKGRKVLLVFSTPTPDIAPPEGNLGCPQVFASGASNFSQAIEYLNSQSQVFAQAEKIFLKSDQDAGGHRQYTTGANANWMSDDEQMPNGKAIYEIGQEEQSTRKVLEWLNNMTPSESSEEYEYEDSFCSGCEEDFENSLCICKEVIPPIMKPKSISLHNKDLFKEVSWTLTYQPQSGAFGIFMDYTPNYYITTKGGWFSGLRDSLWAHGVSNKTFGVFYGNKYPMVVEAISKAKIGNYLGSVSLLTESKRFRDNLDFYIEQGESFNKTVIFNRTNCSGLLGLDYIKSNRFASRYPQKMDGGQKIPMVFDGSFYNFNYFYNRVDKDNLPFIKNDVNEIEKTFTNLGFRGKSPLKRLEGDYFITRLIKDNNHNNQLTFKAQKSLTNLVIN